MLSASLSIASMTLEGALKLRYNDRPVTVVRGYRELMTDNT